MRKASTAVLVSILIAPPVLASCPAELGEIETAARSSSSQHTTDLVARLETQLACEPFEQEKAKALLSGQLLSEAVGLDRNLRLPAAAALVEKAASLGADWHALQLKGRLDRSRGAFERAAIAFQDAINLIADSDAKRNDAPVSAFLNDASPQERQNLLAEADEARHLAASGPRGLLVSAATDRAGNPGGVFSAAMDRGAVGVRVPVPILFETDSAELSRVGGEAAREIATFLSNRRPTSITVTGHTDHVGSAAYNLDLSARRAARVAEFLKASGITARITMIGKGFSEPRKLSQDAAYTAAQIDELNRRVEFAWGQ